MAPFFEYLSRILNDPTSSTWYLHHFKESPSGKLQYCGPHFLAAIRYAVNLGSDNSDRFTVLEELASHEGEEEKIINLMASSLAHIRKFFLVQKLHECSSENINPNTVDIIASFIEFLVDILERLSHRSFSWIIIPGEINVLSRRLRFLFVIIRDTPFECTEPEERENILGEIERVANEAGIFLYSFFFTTNHISTMTMDLELYVLLSKLDVVELTIKKHFEMILEQLQFTTSNLTSTSIHIVDSLLHDLNHSLNHRADLVVPKVKDQIKILHEELYSCRSMLRDIELPQDKELKECEILLIDLAYQAEYFIACFVAGDVPVWYLSLRLPSFIQRSKPIRAALTKLKQNSGIRGVQVVETSSTGSSSQDETNSVSMAEDIIVGFKEIRRQIANDLIGGPHTLQIIAITGMGGLGKTTIARKLYNDSNILLHFDKRCWCVVSQTYQTRKLLAVILGSITTLNRDEISKMEHYQLADRVHKSLKGTRYLLVVDDIWKKQAWDDLKRYFPNDLNGSRILFTSRNKDVALQASSESIIHDLPLLSTNECWDLLRMKVFPNSICPQEFQDLGKEIARNCKGLPLVVLGIAAVLASIKKKENLWQEVATNLTLYISKDLDILELSYWHLPLHLKPCFLYLAMFEEDKEIPVKKLLSLWVSEGFIPKNEHKILEDVAEDYLLELIDRSMIQVTKRRSDNRVKTCTIHDLMRDMCLRLGDKENFVKVINEKSSTCEQHHHICFNSYSYDSTSRPFGLHIRSFCYFVELSSPTSNMKRLRVLKLSIDGIGYKVYDGAALGFLVQLRHLECVGSLLNFSSHMNLEFLSIEGSQKIETLLNMPKLRHLHLARYSYVPLTTLDISKAHNLQTLSGITIVAWEDAERLKCLSHLRHLKCKYGQRWNECSPDFISLTELVSLDIRGNYFKFNTINFPIHIKKLSISAIVLSCELLSSIGTLPHLEILKLLDVAFEQSRWNTIEDEFRTLKFLKLDRVTLQEWNTSEDHFPVLEILVLRRCWNPKLLPPDLENIPMLQRIEVLHCAESVRNFARRVAEEQEAAGNEQLNVIISGSF